MNAEFLSMMVYEFFDKLDAIIQHILERKVRIRIETIEHGHSGENGKFVQIRFKI